MKHIHFGAGHFGLGFVCLLSSRAGLRPAILNRRSEADKEPGKGDDISAYRRNELLRGSNVYIVRYLLAGHLMERAEVRKWEVPQYERFLYFDEAIGNPDFVRKYAIQESVLITTSLGSELPYSDVAQLALDIALERARSGITKPCYIVACENKQTTENISRRLEQEISQRGLQSNMASLNIIPLEASVDRVCVSMAEHVVDDRSIVRLDAEPFARLYLQSTSHDAELRTHLSRLPEIVFFTRYIDFEKKKKYWILNGAHAFVSINALYFRAAYINQYLTEEEIDYDNEAFEKYSEKYLSLSQRRLECEQILSELADSFEFFLRRSPAGLEYLELEFSSEKREEYLEEVMRRFSDTHDYVGRVLKTFVKPSGDELESLNIFFERTNPKILEPIKLYMQEKGGAPVAVMKSILRLFELIAAGDDIERVLDARHHPQ